MHEYGEEFYDYISTFAVRSARRIVPLVLAATKLGSVVDFGCGQGAWLSVWKEHGVRVRGVDGPYVDTSRLMIDVGEFVPADLNMPIGLGDRFDLAQSLETAEHLPHARAADFVRDLVGHADRVLFSAAVPGQGGEHHINEQPLEFWRGLFRTHGYMPVDLVRPALCHDQAVQEWYRFNSILYVHEAALGSLTPAALAGLVPDGTRLREHWPLRKRVMHAAIRVLPVPAVDYLSRLVARRQAKAAATL